MGIAKEFIQITAPIIPCLPEENQFPSHFSQYGFGGWREVETVDDLYNISAVYRSVGMAVYVKETNNIYILNNGIGNDNWTPLNRIFFNDNFYSVYIASPKDDWPENYPETNTSPLVFWINPDTGEMYYRPGFNQNWIKVKQVIRDVDGGDFSNL